jgi:5-oxoprolinase (ATP-hydrolysing)
LAGPALIVRGDTQISVAEGWTATRERDGLIRLTRDHHRATAPDLSDKPDPVTLELFNRRFMGVAEAMGAALERTAHSVNIKERLDFSCALFDAEGGLVANAPHMPVHLGSMGASVRAVQARHEQFRPGDAFVLNNPYFGGTHLPDITVVMPVFMSPQDPSPAFHVAARGHHADVGGIQPGSMPPFSGTINDEGVLLDALPMMREGRFLEAEMRAALACSPRPARAPERNLADLKAQLFCGLTHSIPFVKNLEHLLRTFPAHLLLPLNGITSNGTEVRNHKSPSHPILLDLVEQERKKNRGKQAGR